MLITVCLYIQIAQLKLQEHTGYSFMQMQNVKSSTPSLAKHSAANKKNKTSEKLSGMG